MEQRIFVSILLPAFVVKHENQIEQLLKQTLNLFQTNYEIFEIPSSIGKEFCVRLSQNSINLQEIERVITENRNLQSSYEKCKESLQAMNAEFEKIINDPQALSEQDKLKFQKQQKKHKTLKDENKRLRQLLKSQLDNSEKQRIETQSTVETLKEELDLLVKVMLFYNLGIGVATIIEEVI